MSGCEKQMCCYPSCACDVPLAKRPTATMSREELIASLREYAFKAGLPEHRSIMLEAVRQLSAPSATLLKGAGGEHFTLDAEGWPQRIEPVAYIEHHKGGDNLTWEPVDHPYAKATPLYKAPVSATLLPSLTFDAFRRANAARCVKWHPAGIESWSPSDWLTAVTGELGELASLLKMRNRERDGLPGNKFSPTDKQVADELADVLTYLDLLAAALGVDLGAAAVEKFNEVSERVGFPDRITVSATALPRDVIDYCYRMADSQCRALAIANNEPAYKRLCEVRTALRDYLRSSDRGNK